MPKINLVGHVNGDFVVLSEYAPKYNDSGKKQLRWLCECKKCHEKEVVLGESIRRNRHKLCTCCNMSPDANEIIQARVAAINAEAVKLGYEPITTKQWAKMFKRIQGTLPEEEYAELPQWVF